MMETFSMTDDFTGPDNTMPFDDSKPTAASQAVNGVKAASQQFSDAIQAGSQPVTPLYILA
jgi:hypothetical protein